MAWLSGIVIVLLSIAALLAPGPLGNLEHLEGVQNPFGLEGAPWLTDAVFVVLPLLPLCMFASALSLVLRYRRSGGEEREQIKWIVFAGSFVVVLYLAAMIAGTVIRLVYGPETPRVGELPWFDLLTSVVLLSFTAVPVAIGFAVLKYRLYAIDVLINRTLVYGALTSLLVLTYAGSVVVLQGILRALTGQESQLAIVASTLAVAALFNPLRRRIQSFIDRRFYREKYNARTTLEAFSTKLRDETDLEALNAELVGVVKETMQPAHVSLWLRPDMESKKNQVPG